MNTPKYLLAKYIPDFARMEPRNIGVLLWSQTGVSCKFIGEKPSSGTIDGRSVPAYIQNLNAYKEWVYLWKTELNQDLIEPPNGGAPISREDPQFLEALKQLSRGHFVLTDGGYFLDSVQNLDHLTNELYRSLVMDEDDKEEIKDPALIDMSEELFDASGISKSPNFKSNFEVRCKVGDAEDNMHFNYAYKNGSLNLLQRVALPSRPTMTETKVHSTAWMFDRVVKAGEITADHGFCLVHVSPEMKEDSAIKNGLAVLKEVSRVINLYEQKTSFLNQLQEWRLHEMQQQS